MNIVIAGDSEVGIHLAGMLSGENHNVTLIAPTREFTRLAEAHADLMIVYGDPTSREVLKEALMKRADLCLCVNKSSQTNLLTAIMAKKMGARKCIAKINDPAFTTDEYKAYYKELGVDYLLSPEKITAKEISILLANTAATEIFDFTGNQLSLMLIKLEKGASVLGKSLNDIASEYDNLDFRAVAIHRRGDTIIPRGNDVFQENDMAYVVTKPDGIDHLLKLGGKERFQVNNVMVVGGGVVGTLTAARLEKRFNVKLFELDGARADELSDELKDTLVIKGDARNITLLEDEGIRNIDAFIAVTNNSETNILTCLLARKYGVKKTIAMVENLDFIDISQNVGIDTIINKKLATASYIIRFTMVAEVISTKCLTGIDAEVFEFLAKEGSPITRRPIKELRFPQKAIIGGIIRGNKGHIARGDLQIEPGDKVVVFALPHAFNQIDKMFKV